MDTKCAPGRDDNDKSNDDTQNDRVGKLSRGLKRMIGHDGRHGWKTRRSWRYNATDLTTQRVKGCPILPPYPNGSATFVLNYRHAKNPTKILSLYISNCTQDAVEGASCWPNNYLLISHTCSRNSRKGSLNSAGLIRLWPKEQLPTGLTTVEQRPWEPYSYRASSTVEHSILRQFARGSREHGGDRGDRGDRGAVCCLTLNDIQNSLQLILFRMHKYKQMGMPQKPGHNPGPLTSFSFSFSCPDSQLGVQVGVQLGTISATKHQRAIQEITILLIGRF